MIKCLEQELKQAKEDHASILKDLKNRLSAYIEIKKAIHIIEGYFEDLSIRDKENIQVLISNLALEFNEDIFIKQESKNTFISTGNLKSCVNKFYVEKK